MLVGNARALSLLLVGMLAVPAAAIQVDGPLPLDDLVVLGTPDADLHGDGRVWLIATFQEGHVPTNTDLAGAGAHVLHRFVSIPAVGVTVLPNALDAFLEAFPHLEVVQYDEELRYMLDTAAAVTDALNIWGDAWWPSVPEGLAPIEVDGVRIDGTGVTVGVVDSGVNALHPDLWYGLPDPVGAAVADAGLAPKVKACVNYAESPVHFIDDEGNPSETHPFNIASNLVADTVGPQDNPYCDQSVGHGTHVAGIVAGTGYAARNGLDPLADPEAPYVGIAPGAELVAAGAGVVMFVMGAARGLDWMYEHREEHGIKVVTNSWGDTPDCRDMSVPQGTNAIHAITNQLVAAGITVLFAAGNYSPDDGDADGTNDFGWMTSTYSRNPTPGVINVANYFDGNRDDRDHMVAGSSSDGCVLGGREGDDDGGTPNDPDDDTSIADYIWTWPDVAAPGTGIISTASYTGATVNGVSPFEFLLNGETAPGYYPPFYVAATGTSMATPHVAGIVALMYQANPTITPAEVERILIETATRWTDSVTTEQGAGYAGTGMWAGTEDGCHITPAHAAAAAAGDTTVDATFPFFTELATITDPDLFICRDFKRGAGLVDAYSAVLMAMGEDPLERSASIEITTDFSQPVDAGLVPVAGDLAHAPGEGPSAVPVSSDSFTDVEGDAKSPFTDIINVGVQLGATTLDAQVQLVDLAPTVENFGQTPTSVSLVVNGISFDSFAYLTVDTFDTGAGEYMPTTASDWDDATSTVNFYLPLDYLESTHGMVAPFHVHATANNGGVGPNVVDDVAPDSGNGPYLGTTTEKVVLSAPGAQSVDVAVVDLAFAGSIDLTGADGDTVITASWVDAFGTTLAVDTVTADVGGGVDETPPSQVQNLVVADGLDGDSLRLSWDAATDNVGVDHYVVLRSQTSGSGHTEIATPSGTSYTDTGLTAGATYYYTVHAVDAADNAGSASAEHSGTPTQANRDPVLAAIGNKQVQAGSELEISVSATDADNDALTLSATTDITTHTFEDHGDGTGTFTWTPAAEDEGSHNVVFGVSDGEASDSETITITVQTAQTDRDLAFTSPTEGASDVAADALLEGVTAFRQSQDADPYVVVAIVDTGINPYHPDFAPVPGQPTGHPSTYLEGFPENAASLDLTCQATTSISTACASDFAGVGIEDFRWIPGTKIVGAIRVGDDDYTEDNPLTPEDEEDPGIVGKVRVLDEDGHGTGSASVAVGNSFGTCANCLLVVVEGFDGLEWAAEQPWIDIVSNSWGRNANVGVPGASVLGFEPFMGTADTMDATRAYTNQGGSVLFAAGNGANNMFAVPISTYTSPYTGADWHFVVGAVSTGEEQDEDGEGERSIIGSGKPVMVSSYGSGNIPSSCSETLEEVCQHGGTSAATPITAGAMASILASAKTLLGDATPGPEGAGVAARGSAVPGNPWLADGALSRGELWSLTAKTASQMGEGIGGSGPVYSDEQYTYVGGGDPLVLGTTPADVAMTGYGIVNRWTRDAAIDILEQGQALPDRAEEDAFMEADSLARTAYWGEWGGVRFEAPTTASAGVAGGVVAPLPSEADGDGVVPFVAGDVGQITVTNDATHLEVTLQLLGAADLAAPTAEGNPATYEVVFETDHNGVENSYALSFQYSAAELDLSGLVPGVTPGVAGHHGLVIHSAPNQAGLYSLCDRDVAMDGSSFDQEAKTITWKVRLDEFLENNKAAYQSCNQFTREGRGLEARDVLRDFRAQSSAKVGLISLGDFTDETDAPADYLVVGSGCGWGVGVEVCIDLDGPAGFTDLQHASASIDQAGVTWTLDPNPDLVPGAYSATATQYRDGTPTGDTATVTFSVPTENQAPTAAAGDDQTVSEGALVTLAGSCSDPEGALASCTWSQVSGPDVTITDNGDGTGSFTAPEVTQQAVVVLRLTATDDEAATHADDVGITINDVPVNQAPTADAGVDQAVDEGASVTLDGTASSDDTAIVTWLWEQTAGPTVQLSDAAVAEPTFTAPSVPAEGATLTFRLTVTDGEGASDSDTADVVVSDVPENQAPVANAGDDRAVNEGAEVVLDGTCTDPEDDLTTCTWSFVGDTPPAGWTDGADPASFTAPEVEEATQFTFRLTATDGDSATGTDDVVITVQDVPENQAPTAAAGDDQSVNEGAVVTLAGSCSDPEGALSSCSWAHVSGPVVTVQDGGDGTGSFTAPEVTQDAVIVLELTATDGQGASHKDQVSITVRDVPNQAPVLASISDVTIDEEDEAVIALSASDNDGDAMTFDYSASITGTLTDHGDGTATFRWTAPEASAGSYEVTFTVSDGEAQDSQAMTIVVEERTEGGQGSGTADNAAPEAGAVEASADRYRRGATITVGWTATVRDGDGRADIESIAAVATQGGQSITSEVSTQEDSEDEGAYDVSGTVTLPANAALGDWTLTLTVTDGEAQDESSTTFEVVDPLMIGYTGGAAFLNFGTFERGESATSLNEFTIRNEQGLDVDLAFDMTDFQQEGGSGVVPVQGNAVLRIDTDGDTTTWEAVLDYDAAVVSLGTIPDGATWAVQVEITEVPSVLPSGTYTATFGAYEQA